MCIMVSELRRLICEDIFHQMRDDRAGKSLSDQPQISCDNAQPETPDTVVYTY